MILPPRSLTLSLVALLAAIWLAPTPATAGDSVTTDHLKCFQIKDSLDETEHRTVVVTDLLPAKNPPFPDKTCKIRLPASHLCIETAKTNVLERGTEPFPVLPVVGDPARKFLCYRMRCGRERVDVGARDQFGERVIHTRKGSFLCVPAEDASGATPTTTATPSAAPSATPTASALPTPTATVTATSTVTPTVTVTPTSTITVVPTAVSTPGGPACGGPPSTGGVCSAICPAGQLCVLDGANCRCAPLAEVCGNLAPPGIAGGARGGPLPCAGFCTGVGQTCQLVAGEFCGCFLDTTSEESR